jgi:4-hydroxy-4-methyl-2-oxoglutarate aldolase
MAQQSTRNQKNAPVITLDMARSELSVPLLCDALDALGVRNQATRLPFKHLTAPFSAPAPLLIGHAKTTLWCNMAHVDLKPYDLELAAVDSCEFDEVIVCAAGGSMRSGIWGELLSTAAKNTGCVGVLCEGAVRDVAKMRAMGFDVYALGTSPYDSKDRQRVVDYDVAVEIDGVRVEPGDLVAADEGGVVFVPHELIQRILGIAWSKAHDENQVRDAIRDGMTATKAFETYGVL